MYKYKIMVSSHDEYEDTPVIEPLAFVPTTNEQRSTTLVARVVEDIHVVLDTVHTLYSNRGINDDPSQIQCTMMIARVQFVEDILNALRKSD